MPDFGQAVQINVADFKEMVHQVAFAASTDEARPVLMGVLVKVDGETITMAAADGFRLSVRTATLSSPAAQPFRPSFRRGRFPNWRALPAMATR